MCQGFVFRFVMADRDENATIERGDVENDSPSDLVTNRAVHAGNGGNSSGIENGPSSCPRIEIKKGIYRKAKRKSDSLESTAKSFTLPAPKGKIPRLNSPQRTRQDVQHNHDPSETCSSSCPALDSVDLHWGQSGSTNLTDLDSDDESHCSGENPSRPRSPTLSATSGAPEEDLGMFDPVRLTQAKEFKLSDRQNRFVALNFSRYIKHDIIVDTVLKQDPVPVHEALVTPQADQSLLEMIGSNVKDVKSMDSSLARIQAKLHGVMGPLGNLWDKLFKVSERNIPSCHIDEVLGLLEKSVLLVGQTNATINYQRRLNVLSKAVGDSRLAQDLLKDNEDKLPLGRDLFGANFFKSLSDKARSRKDSLAIKKELGPVKKPKHKPFRSEAPRQSRQAGREGRSFIWTNSSNRKENYKSGPNKKPWAPKNPGGPKRSVCKSLRCKSETYSQGHRLRERELFCSPFDQPIRAKRRSSSLNCENRRTSEIFHSELGVNNSRPLGVTKRSRSFDRLSGESSSSFPSPMASVLQGGNSAGVPGDFRSSGEGGNSESDGSGQSVSQSYFPPSQERRQNEAHFQSQTLKSLGEVSTFQDGRHECSDIVDSEGRLVVQSRLDRCLHVSPNRPSPQEVSPVPMGRRYFRVRVRPFWAGRGASVVHQDIKASGLPSQTSRDQASDLPGRPPVNEQRQGGFITGRGDNSVPLDEAGFCDQLGQVQFGPISKLGVSRFCARFPMLNCSASSGQAAGDLCSLPGNAGPRESKCKGIGCADRQINGHNPCGVTGTVTLQAPSNAEDQRSSVGEGLRSRCNSELDKQGRAQMVGSPAPSVEWSGHDHSGARPDHCVRCFKKGLGGSLCEPKDSGTLEPPRTTTSYQCVGVESSQFCCSCLCKGTRKCSCSSSGRQYYHGCSHKQNGGNQISDSDRGDTEFVEFLPETRDHPYCKPSGRKSQSGGRPRVQSLPRLEQLEACSRVFPGNKSQVGSSSGRPVCRPTEQPTSKVLQLEGRPIGGGDRCFPAGLDKPLRLCVPSVLHDQSLSVKNSKRENNNGDSHPSLAGSTLVPTPASNVCGLSVVTPLEVRHVEVKSTTKSSAGGEQNVELSGVESFRERSSVGGLSQEAASLVSGAWRSGTQTAYNSAWAKWACWCGERQINPFQASVVDVSNFLTDLHGQGLQYSTINGYRSAISALHPKIGGVPVGQQEIVVKVMKGIFHDRPPLPRYTETWDVKVVLDYLTSLGDNNMLGMKSLTQKLAMLMALTSAARGSELRAINPKLIVKTDNSFVCHIPGLTKGKRQSKPHFKLVFEKFEENLKVDVFSTLEAYLDRTRKLRISNDQENQLFLAVNSPHRPVVTCTVARWLKNIISEAGIDVGLFKAHSTRAAATSKARSEGLAVEQICKMANWSGVSVFEKFYNKNTSNERSFQSVVLS